MRIKVLIFTYTYSKIKLIKHYLKGALKMKSLEINFYNNYMMAGIEELLKKSPLINEPKEISINVMDKKNKFLFDAASQLTLIPYFHKTLTSALKEYLPLFKQIEEFRIKNGYSRADIIEAINDISGEDLIFDDEHEGQYGLNAF